MTLHLLYTGIEILLNTEGNIANKATTYKKHSFYTADSKDSVAFSSNKLEDRVKISYSLKVKLFIFTNTCKYILILNDAPWTLW